MSLDKTLFNDALLARLEAAGGEMTSAISRTPTCPIRDEMTTINILIGDCRAAVVKVMMGTDPDKVYAELAERSQDLRKTLGG
jgi:rRNA processing protein Krr1/Pno1